MKQVINFLEEWVRLMKVTQEELETIMHSDDIQPHPLTQAKEYKKRIEEFSKAIKVLKKHEERN